MARACVWGALPSLLHTTNPVITLPTLSVALLPSLLRGLAAGPDHKKPEHNEAEERGNSRFADEQGGEGKEGVPPPLLQAHLDQLKQLRSECASLAGQGPTLP
jgi:hypothetical protein